MLRAALFSTAITILSYVQASPLELSVKTNEEEKLVYLHLWGPIVNGDEEKFKAVVLPYLRKGYLLYQVDVFTGGGNVEAAMSIGDQIRTLQARTTSPTQFVNEPGYAQCWFVASASHGGVGYHPNTNYKRNLKTGAGVSWCDCASACFLIWASGVTREGNFVGIHRLYFEKTYFGSLPAAQAKAAYAGAEKRFRDYLAKLNVPGIIVDRLFATDSRSMYYLTKSDLELMQSTPYLEELTHAKCPPDRTKREYYPDGRWKSTTYDPVRINCYRSILKEVMRDGVRNYLAGLGEQPGPEAGAPSIPQQPVVPVAAPAANPSPVTPSVPNDATSVWIHNGSTVYLVTSPANGRKFLYEIPKPAIQDGPKDGRLLFDGKRQGQEYVGMVYAYWGSCKTEQYSVRGRISSDEKKIVLRGRAPQKNSNCDALGFKPEELVLDHKQNLEPRKP